MVKLSLWLSLPLWSKESSRAARIKWKISSKAQKERRPTKIQKKEMKSPKAEDWRAAKREHKNQKINETENL
jgi:hypothetical protein